MKMRKISTDRFPKMSKDDFGKEPLGYFNGVDADGHYDETKDPNLMKRIKREYPETYEKIMKIMESELKESEKKSEDE